MQRRVIAPYDLRVAAKTTGIALIASLAVVLVEWVTEERGGGAATRGGAIGALPLAPIAGALAVLIALVPSRASGEERALAALGASPWRARAASVITAVLLGSASAIALASGANDVRSLFPPPARPADWRVGDVSKDATTFVSGERGVRVLVRAADVHLEQAPALGPSTRGSEPPPRAGVAAAATIACATASLSIWIASPSRRRPLRTLLSGTAYGVAQVAVFQLAGARAAHPFLTVGPSLALLAFAAWELRHEAWLGDDETWT